METRAFVLPRTRVGIGVEGGAADAAAARNSLRDTLMRFSFVDHLTPERCAGSRDYRPALASLADDVQRNGARVRHTAMLEKIDALPCPQREPAFVNRDAQLRGRQRGANVRGHVVWTFGGVAIML